MTSQRGRNCRPNPKYAENVPKTSARSTKDLKLQHDETKQCEKDFEGEPLCKTPKLDRKIAKKRNVKEPPKPIYRKEIFQRAAPSNDTKSGRKSNSVVNNNVVEKYVGKRNVSKTSDIDSEAKAYEEILHNKSTSQLKSDKGKKPKQLVQQSHQESHILAGSSSDMAYKKRSDQCDEDPTSTQSKYRVTSFEEIMHNKSTSQLKPGKGKKSKQLVQQSPKESQILAGSSSDIEYRKRCDQSDEDPLATSTQNDSIFESDCEQSEKGSNNLQSETSSTDSEADGDFSHAQEILSDSTPDATSSDESDPESGKGKHLEMVKYVGKHKTKGETVGIANIIKSKFDIEKHKKMNIAPLSPRTMTCAVLGLSYELKAFTKSNKRKLHSTTDEDLDEDDFNDQELWPLLYDEDIQHVELELLKPTFRHRLVNQLVLKKRDSIEGMVKSIMETVWSIKLAREFSLKGKRGRNNVAKKSFITLRLYNYIKVAILKVFEGTADIIIERKIGRWLCEMNDKRKDEKMNLQIKMREEQLKMKD